MVHAPGQRLEGGAVDVLGGRQGHRLRRPAVEPAAERDECRAPGRHPRELDRGLDRLGTRVRQERPPRAAGQQALQPLVQAQARLVEHDVLLAVEELRGLGGHGGRHPRMGVTRVGDADPRRVVEVARPVPRDQPRSLAAVDVEAGDPAPDGRHDAVVGEGSGARFAPGRARGAQRGTTPVSWRRAIASSRIDRRRDANVERATRPTAVRKMIVPTTLTCGGMPIRAWA